MKPYLYLLTLLPALIAGKAFAQQTSHQYPQQEINLKGYYFLKDRDFARIVVNASRFDYYPLNGLSKTPPFNDFNAVNLLANYEWRTGEKTYVGTTFRQTLYGSYTPWALNVYAGHRGKINRTEFFKQIALEREWQVKDVGNNTRVDGLFSIVQPFYAGTQLFRVALSGQFSMRFTDDKVFEDEPLVNTTRFRADVNYFPVPNLQLNLFAERKTDYYITDTGQQKENLNLVFPVYGVGISYYIDRHGITDRMLKNN